MKVVRLYYTFEGNETDSKVIRDVEFRCHGYIIPSLKIDLSVLSYKFIERYLTIPRGSIFYPSDGNKLDFFYSRLLVYANQRLKIPNDIKNLSFDEEVEGIDSGDLRNLCKDFLIDTIVLGSILGNENAKTFLDMWKD